MTYLKKMRTNEPFHGIILVGGHVVFHVGLLVASLLIIQFPERTEANTHFLDYINYFRLAHGVNVLYKALDYCLSAPDKFAKFMFTQKMLETISMFAYFITAMFALWGVSKFEVSK